jgi:hypothetical protein
MQRYCHGASKPSHLPLAFNLHLIWCDPPLLLHVLLLGFLLPPSYPHPRTFLIRSDFDVFFTGRDMADQAFHYFDKDNDQRLSLREMKVGVRTRYCTDAAKVTLGPCTLMSPPGSMKDTLRNKGFELLAVSTCIVPLPHL